MSRIHLYFSGETATSVSSCPLQLRRGRAYRSVCRERINSYIVKRDIVCADEEGIPARGIKEADSFDGNTCGVVCQEQDGTIISIARILVKVSIKILILVSVIYQNFEPSKSVIPSLTIAIQSSTTVNLDVFTSPYPECDRLLEGVIEVVRLPVLDIVGELPMSRLDVS
jgi:hypothetical protein